MTQTKVLVTGADGFIGHSLATYLKKQGYWVRGVDLKYPDCESTAADEFEVMDLRQLHNDVRAADGMDEVYALAADMGGDGLHLGKPLPDPLQQQPHQPAHDRGGADQRREETSLTHHRIASTLNTCSSTRR